MWIFLSLNQNRVRLKSVQGKNRVSSGLSVHTRYIIFRILPILFIIQIPKWCACVYGLGRLLTENGLRSSATAGVPVAASKMSWEIASSRVATSCILTRQCYYLLAKKRARILHGQCWGNQFIFKSWPHFSSPPVLPSLHARDWLI